MYMDLINRESLINNLKKFAPEHYNDLIDSLITKEPIAFDKEKVISQIQEKSYWESWSKVIDTNKAVWIVEKGGIDG